ncbi:Outer dynein arm protein 1 [Fasciola hepatica]|uniref:Outer dynein arm protein 1 n=1 Tax=Fasciola hepatica TaxID=6192 RepID=A0A4E0QZR9_FASHE|nr:Outer dynein arm protein 1 [Fasciola hepatica]
MRVVLGMPRPSSAQTEPDEGTDVILLEEYERLQHQLRIIQNERQKQTEETNVKMGKYNHEIGMLEAENGELQTWLALINSDQNRKKDMDAIETLKKIISNQDALKNQIEEVKRYNERLDADMKKYEKMIAEKQRERKKQLKLEAEAGELKWQLERKTSTMETSLHTKTAKFCDTLAQNEELKSEIENLRNQRKNYLILHKRLSEKLDELNKRKAKITQLATAAYDQRDDAKNKRMALAEKNEKDNAAFEAEVRELKRLIDHDEQLYKFMTTKSNERLEWKREAEKRRLKHGVDGEIARKQQREKIEEFVQAMNRIQEITDAEDIDTILRIYRRKEEDNFTIFNYVTELNNQIEDLNEDIAKLEKSMKECTLSKEKIEAGKFDIMRHFERRMNTDKEAADADELRAAQIHKIIDQVKSQVKNLVIKLGCDVTKIVERVGSEREDVTEANLMLYLRLLEQRVDELLSIKCFSMDKGHTDGDRTDDIKSGFSLSLLNVPKYSKDLVTSLPSLTDEEEDYGDGQHAAVRPLSQMELIHRVTKELQKQDGVLELCTQRSSSRGQTEPRKLKK